MTALTLTFAAPAPVVLTGAGALAVEITRTEPAALVQSPALGLEIAPPAVVSLSAAPALALTFPEPQAVSLQVKGIQGPPGIGGGGGGSAADSFETVAKNLAASGSTITYAAGEVDRITYANGVIKAFAYGPDGLASVTLSGATPGVIALTKTFTYSGGDLTAVSYS